ncbi:murein L,D-transpeptidase YcbB/YkuD [Azomonas agilis]|uniref:Murein L,D-transpeptidase YcbB/YkuD n=1 Tax=Azomonas agilis TaxID=116849 RepID=A0A562IK44_9GAMM|nr:murein L,D-transpeptidase YcbB/YkuD [Azomonas agilis]
MFKKSVLCLLLWGASSLARALANTEVGETLTEAPSTPAPPVLQVLERPATLCPQTQLLDPDTPFWQVLHGFYQRHAYALAWQEAQHQSRLKAELEHLADDGLDPELYHLDLLQPSASESHASEIAAACADVQISQIYLMALRHLSQGLLDQSRLEPIWYAEGVGKDRLSTLLNLADQGWNNPAQAFSQARPSLDLYTNLRRLYAQLRQKAGKPLGQPVPAGPTLRPGMDDERVPVLVQRLYKAGYLKKPSNGVEDNSRLYSDTVAKAVAAFQKRNGLSADGLLGEQTRTTLNIDHSARLDQLRINLERLRWVAYDTEPDMLLVDVTGARLIYYRNQQPVWSTRTQVGQPDRATPLLRSTVNRLTLNPTWTVPPTILKEDKLPRIRRNPSYLQQHGIQVLNLEGQPISPSSVDWNNPKGIRLRQQAGPNNPLGQVAIRFPNPFAVYLHDTPSRHLFSRDTRALSSGCVRVEQALKLVDVLLTDPERDPVKQILGTGKTSQYRLDQPVPILIGYWTADVDSKGQIQYRADVYQKDPALLAAWRAGRPSLP